MSAQVKKVVIQIGKREIELSVEDAKALKEALDGMFDKAQIITIPQPYPVPYTPWPTWIGPWYGTVGGTTWEASCQGDTQYLAVNKT